MVLFVKDLVATWVAAAEGSLSSSDLSSAQADSIVSDHSLFSSVRGLDIGVNYTLLDDVDAG
jgi:hypothetical protein